MEEIIKIRGHFIFEKYRNGDFAIFSFKLYDKTEKRIIVKGNIPDIDDDLLYELMGYYVNDLKYGIQFNVANVSIALPSEEELIIKYLSSSLFKGIGKKTAKKIYDALGDDCLNLIREDYNILNQVEGLNPKHIKSIKDGFDYSEDGLKKNIEFFTMLGLSFNQINKINAVYGEDAIEILSKNPYSLVYDVNGIGIESANKIAKYLKFESNHYEYEEALVVNLALKYAVSSGDTYIEYDVLKRLYERNSNNYFDEAFELAIFNQHLINDEGRIYHYTQFDAEYMIANSLLKFPFEPLNPVDDGLLDEQIRLLQSEYNISYDPLQIEGIKAFYDNDFSIITGGPGTGKTTVVKALISVFKHFYPNHNLACIAPTGRASKRLKELCDVQAYTIHSILGYDLETNKFSKDASNPINYDALIIDEASMIDNWLFYNLLVASNNVKKICIIGDEDQLPSVGPGQLLKDLIDCNLFPCTRLVNIHRQKEGSDIIDLSLHIKNGSTEINPNYNEVKFYNTDSNSCPILLSNIIDKALNKGHSIEDIQVLSSQYKGVSGIDNINTVLQREFNPDDGIKKQIKVGYTTFRENDKILQLKNQADDNVFNGDIGMLVEIEEANESDDGHYHVYVDFDGTIVEYTSANIMNITLAYCISIHKSQGSEYPIVIVLCNREAYYMLNRNLLYTGITRASKSLILIGEKHMYDVGINKIMKNRKTNLVNRLLNI